MALGKGYLSKVEIEVEQATNFPAKKGITQPVVFEIGSNREMYIEAILRKIPSCAIYAFEPNRESFEILFKKFLGWGQVRAYKLALGYGASQEILYKDAQGRSLASLTPRNFEHLQINQQECIERVSMTSVDDFVMTERIYPDFLKIDVEGFELEVLKGARTTLQNDSLIQFEFGGTYTDSRIYFRDSYDLLSKKVLGLIA